MIADPLFADPTLSEDVSGAKIRDRLLMHFNRLAEAPEAIPLLRRFIVDLAVRGKLVEQNPSDEPASKLLQRISVERARESWKREERLQPRQIVKPPFAVPKQWEWVRFGEIAQFAAGRTPSRHDLSFWNTGDFHWVSISDLQDGEVVATTKETVSKKAKTQIFHSEPSPVGTLVMSFKLTIGKISRLGVPAFHNEAIVSIHSYIKELEPYLFIVLPKFSKQGHTKDAVKGATLNRQSIANILVPLPPLAEQRAIVAKVDELMELCDLLKATTMRREVTRDRLSAASLARLSAPDPDPAIFANHVRFALDNLAALTMRTDQIKRLRQTILNLAVHGHLVPQNPGDEPPANALKRIAAERADLIEKRLVRPEKALEPIGPIEPPFEIPGNWVWSRIGNAVLFTQYGTSEKSQSASKGVPVLTMGNIQDGLVIWGSEKTIPESSDDLPTLYLNKFDILYNRTNSAELVGKTGIYLGEDGIRTFASYLIRIRASQTSGCPRYLNLAMCAPVFRESQIVPLIKKQTGQANVNGTALKNMLIPLPPLTEQYLIVARVDELMAVCDRLEAELKSVQTNGARFLEAILHEALTGLTVT